MLELDKSENWNAIFNKTVNAIKATNTRHAPIPSIKAEVDIDRRILAVQVISSNAKKTWNWAGYLNQMNTSISNALGANSQTIVKRKLWLNQINLLIFPEHTLNYRISIEVPEWFENVTLNVWKYIGVDNTADNSIADTLANIETKVDEIAEYNR